MLYAILAFCLTAALCQYYLIYNLKYQIFDMLHAHQRQTYKDNLESERHIVDIIRGLQNQHEIYIKDLIESENLSKCKFKETKPKREKK